MRKFTKMMLTLALLVGAVGGVSSVKAEKIRADLSRLKTIGGTNATWDGATNTITWVGQSNNMVTNFNFPTGDLGSWKTMNVRISSLSNAIGVRIQIKASGVEKTKAFNGTDLVTVNISDYGFTSEELKNVEWIRMLGSGYYDGESHTINSDTPGSAVISEVYMERPDVISLTEEEVKELPEGAVELNGMKGAADQAWTVAYPKTLGSDEQLIGASLDNDGNSVDISQYNYLHVIVTAVSNDANFGLRVFPVKDDVREVFYVYPIDVDENTVNWTAQYRITSPGTYVVNIKDYTKLRGLKSLQGWQGNAGTITVSGIYLTKGESPVEPISRTTLLGAEALTDETATVFDVTALPGTGRVLNAANPNALFIANEGTLANTKNVIVDDECTNLELTDGKPFKAPKQFTAGNAKFTKPVTDAGYATMVIPFPAAVPVGAEAFELTGVSGTAITTNQVTSLVANKPVMIKATENDYEFTATDVTVPATPDGLVENGLLKATYTTTTAAADANNYVLQKNSKDVNFYLVTGTSATVKPFRAYLHYVNPGAHILSILFDDATGIEKVEKEASVKENGEFFNLAGQRVAHPTKGLYIVNGKKVVIK